MDDDTQDQDTADGTPIDGTHDESARTQEPPSEKADKVARRAAAARKRADLVARQQQALGLKVAGATYDEIARQLGYSDRSAARKAYLGGLAAPARETRDEARVIERLRLERMHLAVWPRVIGGDLEAIGCALKISTQRCLLDGLNAAGKFKLEHTGEGGGPIEHKDMRGAPDLSRLTDEELQQYKQLLDRILAPSAPSVGPSPGEGLGSEGGDSPPEGEGGDIVI